MKIVGFGKNLQAHTITAQEDSLWFIAISSAPTKQGVSAHSPPLIGSYGGGKAISVSTGGLTMLSEILASGMSIAMSREQRGPISDMALLTGEARAT
jgi:hypothetical protein